MKAEYRLTQGEVAELIQAALGYNGHHCVDVAFDLSNLPNGGGIEVVATCETEPLKVRHVPEEEGQPGDWSSQLLKRMVSGNVGTG